MAKNDESIKILDNTFENIRREGIYLDGKSFTNGDVEIQNNNFISVYPSSPGSEIIIKNIQDASVSGNQILKVPVAAFSALPASGLPNEYSFTDTSTGSPTAWNWNFGDYTTNSALQNPTHTYSIAGNYTVALTASNAAGSNTVTGTVHVTPPEESVVSEIEVSDNRLREASPDTVYQSSPYIDVGGMNSVRYRDIIWFNLNKYTGPAEISNAALSLYWYYPAGNTRPEDTVIEVYRPVRFLERKLCNGIKKKTKILPGINAGGDWYDKKNGVSQWQHSNIATITLRQYPS